MVQLVFKGDIPTRKSAGYGGTFLQCQDWGGWGRRIASSKDQGCSSEIECFLSMYEILNSGFRTEVRHANSQRDCFLGLLSPWTHSGGLCPLEVFTDGRLSPWTVVLPVSVVRYRSLKQFQPSWLRNASALVYFRNDELSDYKDWIEPTILVRKPIPILPRDFYSLRDDASTNPGLSLRYSSIKNGIWSS